jgi:uncharacterized membrane protein YdcZ (DUF606 family)
VDRGLAVALTAGVGGAIALHAPINSHLARPSGRSRPRSSRSRWLGLAQRSITTSRVTGIALLAAGVFLVVRN